MAYRSKSFWGYDSTFMEVCRAELTYSPKQIQDGEFEFHVYELGGNVVAFYVLTFARSEVAELEALFVEPACIGKGIGKALVVHARARASQRGAERIVVQGDPNAVSFYRAVGAVCTGQRESGSFPGRQLPLFAIELRKNVNKVEAH